MKSPESNPLRATLAIFGRENAANWDEISLKIIASGDASLIPLLRDIAVRQPVLREQVLSVITVLKQGPALPPPENPVPSLIKIRAGRLGIGHRPRLRALPLLSEAGVTDVLTLLTQKEGAYDIKKAVQAAGLQWHWLPLPNGQPPSLEQDTEITKVLFPLLDRLDAEATVFVHCSAGIHRTGMIVAAILGLSGCTDDTLVDSLGQMRRVTAEGVGEERLGWARAFTRRCEGFAV